MECQLYPSAVPYWMDKVIIIIETINKATAKITFNKILF